MKNGEASQVVNEKSQHEACKELQTFYSSKLFINALLLTNLSRRQDP